jgi:CheY-like chemotaxis protein
MNAKIHILLIDDDVEDQKFVQIAIDRAAIPAEMECVQNGREALDLLKLKPGFKPEIILLDINMPLINGMECLRELKRINRLKDTSIYIYSTYVDEGTTGNYFSLGAEGVIKKMPSIAALKEKLSEIFLKEMKKKNMVH